MSDETTTTEDVKKDKAKEALLAELQRDQGQKNKGLFTDEAAALASVSLDKARVVLHTLLAEDKVERTSVEYDDLPCHIQINVKPGMSRFRWRLK